MPLRPTRGLTPLSWLYGAVVRWRNRQFDRARREQARLPVPVVSVGNLTAGGTGKTQAVAWLVERYRRAGYVVGVLARGYGREEGARLNDEGRMLERRFSDLPPEQDPVRYEAGQRLLARKPCDLLLLDDGMQHRRLARDLEICCLDARDPFAGGRLLPAGYLREPAEPALQRVQIVFLTGAERTSEAELDRSIVAVRGLQPSLPVYAFEVAPELVIDGLSGEEVAASTLKDRPCFLAAGIARPERFRETVESLGARVEACRFFGDHRPLPKRELQKLSEDAERSGGLLLVTEKDAARMEGTGGARVPHAFLRVTLRCRGDEPPLGDLLPSSVKKGDACD